MRATAPARASQPSFIATTFVRLVRRNSVYAGLVFGGSFLFCVAYDTATTAAFEWWNRGKLWKDIRHRYVEQA